MSGPSSRMESGLRAGRRLGWGDAAGRAVVNRIVWQLGGHTRPQQSGT